MKLKLIVCACLIVLALTGCASERNAEPLLPSPMPSASVKPPDEPATGLAAVQQKLNEHYAELKQTHAIEIMYSGIGKDEIVMTVRSYGDYERKLSEQEITDYKESLYKLAGERFPVTVNVMECCEGVPGATGVIKDIDVTNNQILLVNEKQKNGNTDDPVANWVGLTEDAQVFFGDKQTSRTFDDSLIGKEATAWTTGLVLSSYPGIVTAIKLVIE
ncbi:hypothetical protein D7Z26_21020 [Cohnella endophytica]|uniref:Uncharacterized protein n=1 Tax=Cohnella endophytica TaxID=2419778 RepID=A0A494XEA9_9BACL|nr:hypothetical protein [Cohnella endophytica]RKP48858.1 hypothetical protein D7Z26_21020 [Cohnella endophytica]